jgi:transposase
MANSRMLAMAAAIALRSDFTGADLRRLARRTQDAKQARRLLSLATIYDGGSRSDAARIGDVGLQIIRDWVLRFNAAGPDGLVDRKAPGPEPRLNEDHRAASAAAIESGPIPAIHSVVRWRLVDLCQWLWEEFRVSIARQTLSRDLRSLGYRKLTARPRNHAQAAGAIEHFRKVSRPSWQRSRRTNASSLPR